MASITLEVVSELRLENRMPVNVYFSLTSRNVDHDRNAGRAAECEGQGLRATNWRAK